MSRKLTLDINFKNIPRDGDNFGYQISNNGVPLSFNGFDGWDKTFKESVDYTNANGFITVLNSDLTPNTSNNTSIGSGFNQQVYVIKKQTVGANAGKYICGGGFTSYQGQPARKICRLNADFTLDTSFTPPTYTADVRALDIDSSDRIYIGGSDIIGGKGRLQRLSANGALDNSYMPIGLGFDRPILGIKLQPDGKLIVVGVFTLFNNSIPCKGITRMTTTGAIDNTFSAVNQGFILNNSYPRTIDLLSNGQIVVGGDFYSYNNFSCGNLIVIKPDGSFGTPITDVDDSPGGTLPENFSNNVIKVLVDSLDRIYVSGTFMRYGGSVPCNRIIRMKKNSSLNFVPDLDFDVITDGLQDGTTPDVTGGYDMLLNDNDNLVVVGNFGTVQGTTAQNVAVLDPDGVLSPDGEVTTSVFTSSGGIGPAIVKTILNLGDRFIVGGNFNSYSNAGIVAQQSQFVIPISPTFSQNVYNTYDNLVEYNLDYGITYSVIFATVSVYKGVQPNYSTIISGEYDTVTGVFADKIDNSKTYIMSNGTNTDSNKQFFRITASGSIDPTFTPFFSYQPNQSYQLDNGKIITSVFNGVSNLAIYKLNYNGSQDLTFAHTPTSSYDLNIVGNNNYTYTISASGTASIKRYNNTDGTLNTAFSEVKIKYTTGLSTPLFGYRVQSDDKLLVYTGLTSSIVAGGITYTNKPKSVYRFNNNGSLDTTYVLGATLNNDTMYYTYLTKDNKLLLSDFGSTYSRIRRFNTDGSLDNTFTFNSTLFIAYIIQSEQSDGKLLAIPFGNPTKVVRLNTDGSLDTTYNGYLEGATLDVGVSATGYNNGELFIYSGFVKTGSGLVPPVKLDKDGNFITNGINFCNTTPINEPDGLFVIQPDDKAIIYNAAGFSGTSSALIRINPNGTLDNSFNFIDDNEIKEALCLLSSGKILTGGDNDPNIKRFNTDGSLDLTYNYQDQGLGDSVFYIEELSDNSVYIANANMINKISSTGSFQQYGFTGSGVIDADFKSVVKQVDDKILFSISATASIRAKGGTFSKGPGIYRLNTDGSFDNTFNYSAGGLVPGTLNNILKVLPDNRILFSAFSGKLRKLNPNGTLNTLFAFDFNTSGPTGIVSVDVTIDNRIVIGGDFTYLGESCHLIYLDINTGDVLTYLYDDYLAGYVGTKNYSNGDMLAIGNSTWPPFVATGKNKITRITKDANEVFYLDTPIEEEYVPAIVRMEYTFDNQEIVINEVYDTPDYVEITYTNESLTIAELIQEVAVRSPYLIISNAPTFSSVNYKIRVYEGSIFTGPSQSINYDITKDKLFTGQSNIYININNLVRERLEADVKTFNDDTYLTAQLLPDNMSKWVLVDETTFNGSVTQSTAKYYLHALDGYLYNFEEQGSPNVFINGNKRYIHKNQPQRIYFQTNFLLSVSCSIDPDGNFDFEPTWDATDILGDNRKYIQSLQVFTGYFAPGTEYIDYIFTYKTDSSSPDSGRSYSITKRFEIYNDCLYDLYTVVYKNKFGVLESIPFSRKSVKSLESKGVDYERSILDYNGNYDITRHTNKQYNVNGYESWTLNTNWMPEYMNEAFEELSLSEEVWIILENDEIIPIVKEDTRIDFKTQLNDKLIQYTMKVKMSHQVIKNIL